MFNIFKKTHFDPLDSMRDAWIVDIHSTYQMLGLQINQDVLVWCTALIEPAPVI